MEERCDVWWLKLTLMGCSLCVFHSYKLSHSLVSWIFQFLINHFVNSRKTNVKKYSRCQLKFTRPFTGEDRLLGIFSLICSTWQMCVMGDAGRHKIWEQCGPLEVVGGNIGTTLFAKFTVTSHFLTSCLILKLQPK